RCAESRSLSPPTRGSVKSSASFWRDGRMRSSSFTASATLRTRPLRALSATGAGTGAPAGASSARLATAAPDCVASGAGRIAATAQRAGATSWFKNIDSTLRGHVGAEIVALLQATRTPSAVACPAFPSEGRTVLDRVLRVDGTAAAHVVDVIHSESDRPLPWI